MLVLFIALLQAAPATSAMPVPAVKARLIPSAPVLRDWNGPTDIPKGQPARTTAEMSIDEKGCVFVCRVVQGSGSRQADDWACRFARSGRFVPAQDANGKPIPSIYTVHSNLVGAGR